MFNCLLSLSFMAMWDREQYWVLVLITSCAHTLSRNVTDNWGYSERRCSYSPTICWLISPEPKCDGWGLVERIWASFPSFVFLFFLMPHPHCLANRNENRIQGTVESVRKTFLLVCFGSIHFRWHNSWIPLHVWLITLQDQGGQCAGERKVQMCSYF